MAKKEYREVIAAHGKSTWNQYNGFKIGGRHACDLHAENFVPINCHVQVIYRYAKKPWNRGKK